MKLLAACLTLLAAIAATFPQSSAPDPVLQAMRDEIERSRKLTVSDLQTPYFIQYVIDQADSLSMSASLGGLVVRRRTQYRSPQVQVRVGDYSFDNSNFASSGRGRDSGYTRGLFPTEDSYSEMRRYWWLETDSAYKSAVETLSRKRAAVRGISQKEQLNDFAQAEPVHYQARLHGLSVDEDVWANRIRALSALFAKFPEIVNSTVELEASAGGYYIANSEGTEVRAAEDVVFVRARALALAADGMSLRDVVAFHAFDLSNLPSDEAMASSITEMARNLVALSSAPKGEEYNGPVLFEGIAGPQILAELLGKNLPAVRRPVGGSGRSGASAQTSELDGRIGARVLPESFEVIDDPTLKEWHGRPLFGSYDVDREGVIPKPLRVVEKGVLKDFLRTRQPIRGFEGSNGRARFPATYGATAALSNLFVTSTEAVSALELKQKLIELVQVRGKDYGIIVRKMDFPPAASDSSARMGAGGVRRTSAPLLIYKLYPDGREELVRGLRFRNMNARSLKDILAAGNDSQVFDFMNQGSGFEAESCVAAPSILIDDLDVYPIEEESAIPPIVPAP
jgi:predicted Zn-dependent protease